MIRNYLIIALRNLRKTKQFTIINIIGLSIGMAACLLILHYVYFEKSFDKFFDKHERIYRIRYERTSESGETVHFSSCCPPLGLLIRESFHEVEKVGRIWRYTASVSSQENMFIEERMYFAEPEFFEIFNYKMVSGDPVKGLREPNNAYISLTTAKKYFGDDDPVGKSFSVDKKTEYRVLGVFEDIPQNTHLKFDIILSWANLLDIYGKDLEESWGDTGAYTYLLFKDGADLNRFEENIKKLVNHEIEEILKEYKLVFAFPIQKVTDIHLNSHYQQEYEANGDIDVVNFLTLIAIIIIVIAWINYINLSTARSLTRAKEVGLRKVVGASRTKLVMQFFMEVVLINFAAVVLSCFMVELSMPLFSGLTGMPGNITIWESSWIWFVILNMFLIGIFLSGIYPVMALSSYSPILVLKGVFCHQPKGVKLRKLLVVFQFAIALLLFSFTLAVFRQISFMKNKDLGFTKEQILAVRLPRVRDESFISRVNGFKQDLLKKPNIEKVCILTETPGKQIYWDAGGIHPVGSDVDKNYQIVGIDYDFIDLFQVKLIEGRNFSLDFPSDTAALILNETAARWMEFHDPKSAVGSQVSYWGEIFTVIGIMKNYHQQSPKAAFEPHIYRLLPYGRGVRGYFAFKLNGLNLKESIKEIERKYSSVFPGNPFEFYFLDDYYNKQYKTDEIVGKVFSVFSFLAIFVNAIGILGLFSFLVTQRTKEISIRNVLGADTLRILLLLGKEFIWLMITSFIISVPIGIWGISQWLNSYEVKVQLTIWVFIIPFIILLAIATITVSSQVLKALRTNPVENLRYE